MSGINFVAKVVDATTGAHIASIGREWASGWGSARSLNLYHVDGDLPPFGGVVFLDWAGARITGERRKALGRVYKAGKVPTTWHPIWIEVQGPNPWAPPSGYWWVPGAR